MRLVFEDDDGKVLSYIEVAHSDFTVMTNNNAEWMSVTPKLRGRVVEMMITGVRSSQFGVLPKPKKPEKRTNVIKFEPMPRVT